MQKLLRTRPFVTNVVLSTGIMGVGDCIAQRLEMWVRPDEAEYKWARTFVMSSYSATIFTPAIFMVYKLIDKYLRQGGLKNSFRRAVIGNLVTNPWINAVFFVYSTSIEHFIDKNTKISFENQHLNNLTLEEKIQKKLKNEYITTCKTSAMVWIPFATLNFGLVPAHFRLLANSVGAVIWGCYISLAQHRTANTSLRRQLTNVNR